MISAETATSKYEYSYDDRGNILTKKEYAVTVDETGKKVYTLIEANTDTYVYDETWKDKLISYNGQTITYDAVGNPINYMGNTLTWTMGRQLASFGNISYAYNEDGIRTSKTSNGVTTTYYLDGTRLLEQTDGTNTLHFNYDRDGEVVGFTHYYLSTGYDDPIMVEYIYVKNAQGDIVGITDPSGKMKVSYTYYPWGKLTNVESDFDQYEVDISILNPLRYRGYYYDSDIQMYYLQSRYYDARTGRFINSDNVYYIGITTSEISYKPFAYCKNNPINYSDPTGTVAITATATALGVSASTLVASAVILILIVDLATGGKVVLTFSEALVIIAESVYDNIQFNKQNKKTKVPSKLKDGDKVKTPDSHPGEFQKNKDGSYTHKKTKWTFKKDKSNHHGEPHWDASPKNGKEGDYHNIGLDGKLLT